MQRTALYRVAPERLSSTVPILAIGPTEKHADVTKRYGKATVKFLAGTPVTVIVEMLKALKVYDWFLKK